MGDTELIMKCITEHREAAARFRQYCNDASDPDSENITEIREQADACEHIADWLDELLALRRVIECQLCVPNEGN